MAQVISTSSIALGSRTNTTLTAPSSISNGNLLLCIITAGDAGDQTGPSITPPTGFAAASGYPKNWGYDGDTGYGITLGVYTKIASGESGDYTFSHGTANSEAVLYNIAYVDATTPLSPSPTSNRGGDYLGSSGFGSGDGQTTTWLSITTPNNNSLVIAAEACWDDAGGTTPPTGTTPTFSNRYAPGASGIMYVCDGVLATAGATGDKTHTNGNNNANSSWESVLISVQNGASGGAQTGELVGTLTANGGSQVNPSPINGSVTVAVGDLVYAVWTQQTNLTVGTGPANPQDNLSNTYAWCNDGTDPGTPTARAGWSVVTNAGTLTQITAAATASTNNYANFAAVIKGPFQANANQPDANPANGSDNTSPFACPSTGTLAQADEVVMCFWAGATSATQAASSPNLEAGQAVNGTTNRIIIGYQKVSATTAVAPEFTGTASGNQAVTGTTSFKLASTGYTVTADAGSHTLTGTAASTEFGREVAAEAGSYALAGTDASLEYGYEVVASGGSYAVTGTDITFSRTYEIGIEAGSYSIVGQDASLEFGREIVPDAGAYAFGGQDVTLVYGNTLSAEGGAYALSGADASLERGYEATAEAGSYAVSGQDISLSAGARIGADAGSYAISGQDVSVEYGREISADTGSYSLNGTDATLTLTAARTLSADAGAYSISGTDVSLELGRLLYAYNVHPIGLLLTLTHQVGGSYAVAGSDATLTHAVERTLAADSGVYALTGQVANLEFGREVLAGAGSYALSGQDASIEYGRDIQATTGNYTVSGQSASLEATRSLTASAGGYALSGQDAALEYGRDVAIESGAYSITGQDSSVEYGRKVFAEADSYTITGSDVVIVITGDKTIATESGSYALNGSDVVLDITYPVIESITPSFAGGMARAWSQDYRKRKTQKRKRTEEELIALIDASLSRADIALEEKQEIKAEMRYEFVPLISTERPFAEIAALLRSEIEQRIEDEEVEALLLAA